MAWGERAEATMGGLGAIAGASFAAGWNLEAARQNAVAQQVARNVVAAERAIAAVDRAACVDLRIQLVSARAMVARLQTRLDALEAEAADEDCTRVTAPEPTTEVGEIELRTALIYANAEIASLGDEVDDLEADLAA